MTVGIGQFNQINHLITHNIPRNTKYDIRNTIYDIRTIMQNKPNFRKAKMTVTLVKTMTNNNEPRAMNYSKQTQSNPILSAEASAKVDSSTAFQKWGITSEHS